MKLFGNTALLCLIGLFISLAAPAAANPRPVPGPLPAPLKVPNTNPPLVIPGEIVRELQNGALFCRRTFGVFTFDSRFLTRIDLNRDGRGDYVLSSAGYRCDGRDALFGGRNGDYYYFFIAQPNGTLWQEDEEITAFEMKIEPLLKPPQLVFTMPCPRGPGIVKNYGKNAMSWNRDEMKFIYRHNECMGKERKKPAPAPVASAPESPAKPVAPPAQPSAVQGQHQKSVILSPE